MALNVPDTMLTRGQAWRTSYRENRLEYRQIAKYVAAAAAVVITARVIITLSQIYTVLLPAGFVAALIFGAFELAVGAALFTLALVTVLALIGLPLGWLIRKLRAA